MNTRLETAISEISALNDEIKEIKHKNPTNGSNKYYSLSTPTDSYFLKTYDTDPKSSNWEHSKHILKHINQCQSLDSDWHSSEYEYWIIKKVHDTISNNFEKICVPKPIDYLPSVNGILMEQLPPSQPLFLNRHLTRGRHLLNASFRKDAVAQTARALAQIHQSMSIDNYFDSKNYLSLHLELIKKTTIPSATQEFLREYNPKNHTSLPITRNHGDFLPRNILILNDDTIGIVDWTLSIVSHPLIDVHKFMLDLFRWRIYPWTSTNHIRQLELTFRDTYFSTTPFDITGKDYCFTRLTALIRNYWIFIDKASVPRKAC